MLRIRRPCRFRCRDADDANGHAAFFNDRIRSDEGLSRRVDEDIAGEEGKVRFRCPFEGYVLAVVEFVISQRHGVVACSVHKGDSRRALTQIN